LLQSAENIGHFTRISNWSTFYFCRRN